MRDGANKIDPIGSTLLEVAGGFYQQSGQNLGKDAQNVRLAGPELIFYCVLTTKWHNVGLQKGAKLSPLMARTTR